MEGKRNKTPVDMTAIQAVYGWLTMNIDALFSDEAAQESFSLLLRNVHPEIRWEIGPHDNARNFLAYSPNLNLHLLSLTESLALNSPNIADWVFLAAKPRKQWKKRVVSIRASDAKIMEYAFDDWLYYLTSFNDGEFFDVNLVPTGYENRPREELEYVSSLFIEFELGERIFMEFVDRVNIVMPQELKAFGNNVQHLYAQLQQERKPTH